MNIFNIKNIKNIKNRIIYVIILLIIFLYIKSTNILKGGSNNFTILHLLTFKTPTCELNIKD